ncbi:MAG TPA: helix-turn-helix transcriptional regulator [Solirubrobacteraceae bacterium]
MQSSDKEPNLLILGRAVKLTREQRGMSAEDLAAASGIPRERIEALEAGQLDPTYELLVEIADGLGTKPSALVTLAERLRASAEQ